MKMVDRLNKPLVIGENYLVPCIKILDPNTDWYIDNTGELSLKKEFKYIPIINFPHNDVENNQIEVHYHIDDRFTSDDNTISLVGNLRIQKTKEDILIYKLMECIRVRPNSITPSRFIANSKLKHKCIYKGKCPHRGYDLTNEIPIDGVIICPLHALRFNSKTKQLIE